MGESIDPASQAGDFMLESVRRSKNGYGTKGLQLRQSVLVTKELGSSLIDKLRMGRFVFLGRCLVDVPT